MQEQNQVTVVDPNEAAKLTAMIGGNDNQNSSNNSRSVSYTHLRAHET